MQNNIHGISGAETSLFLAQLQDQIPQPKNPFLAPLVYKGKELHLFDDKDIAALSQDDFRKILHSTRDYLTFGYPTSRITPLPPELVPVSEGVLKVLNAIPLQIKKSEDEQLCLSLAKMKFRRWKERRKWGSKKGDGDTNVQSGPEEEGTMDEQPSAIFDKEINYHSITDEELEEILQSLGF